MSSGNAQQRIRRLADRHDAVIEQILNSPAMVRGSFTCVSTRCGKPNCWCASSSKGHSHTRLTWSEQGELMTRKVPAEAVEQVRILTANYRSYRGLRRDLTRLHQQLQKAVAQAETVLTQKTRKPLKFLSLNQKMPPPSAPLQQIKRYRKKRPIHKPPDRK
jgi:hypothetical protein